MQVKRKELLQKLESVANGLSPRDIFEQNSCFIFKGGEVITYNDEVACRSKVDLKITGAITAQKLIELLRRLVEDELGVEQEDGELVLVGKKRQAGIKMDKEILLAVDKIERPKEWSKLPEDFTEAVKIVIQCAGRDESMFASTCVHLAPKFLEASDNYKMARYKIKTGFKDHALVRSSAIQAITQLGMTEYNESEVWLHFRNPSGLIVSCKRYADVAEFPDLTPWLEAKGEPSVLPKGLPEALSRASIFTSENTEEENAVSIELKPGKVRIRGEGASGWYSETKNLKYNGKPMKFYIAPRLFMDLLKQHNECEISEQTIKIDSGKFVYVASLDVSDSKEKEDDE
jgi:hypothetical protein